MPLLKEMPGGPEGTAVSMRAVHFVLFFVACLVYGTVGVFAASIYGQETESNIMVNDILSDPRATLVLYAALILCEEGLTLGLSEVIRGNQVMTAMIVSVTPFCH